MEMGGRTATREHDASRRSVSCAKGIGPHTPPRSSGSAPRRPPVVLPLRHLWRHLPIPQGSEPVDQPSHPTLQRLRRHQRQHDRVQDEPPP
jgi:hypothetical protein